MITPPLRQPASPGTPITAGEQRLRLAFMLAMAALSLAFLLFYLYYLASGGRPINDFFVFWTAAKELQYTPLAQVYDPTAFHAFQLSLDAVDHGPLPFVYPPHAMLLYRAFGLLPFHPAMLVWDALSLAVYLAGAWCLFGPRWPLLLALIAPSVVINMIYGQTGLMTSGLSLLGFSLLRRAPLAAGIALGLLTFKPQLAALPLLVLLLSRERKAILAALCTVALLGLASLAAFHWAAWGAWLQALHSFGPQFSQSSLHYRFGVTVYFTLLDFGIGRPLAIAAQLLVTALVLWSAARAMRRERDTEANTMLILTGLYLATPYALLYDLPLISVVCVMLLQRGLRDGFRDGELLVSAAAWFLPVLLLFGDGGNPALALSILLALYGLILRRLQPLPATSPPAAAAS